MPNRRLFGIGELGLRLAAAFVGVVLAALSVSYVVGDLTFAASADAFIMKQQADLASSAAIAVTAAYDRTDTGWREDLRPITILMTRQGAAMRVTTTNGRVISSCPTFPKYTVQSYLTRPVVIQGRQVGQVQVRFGPAGLGGAVSGYKAQRWRIRITVAAISTLFALVVSVVVARLIAAPLEGLLGAIRARGAGVRDVRIAQIRGVGVLRELQDGFNWAADRLDQYERLRRNSVVDIAHELRTPVAVLQAGHEAMLDGVTQPSAANLASLRDEVLRLTRMVEDLQRLSAAESAAMQLKLAPADVAAIAKDAAASLAYQFAAAAVHLERRLRQVHVMCDANRMREVITNLLTNALKFTPADGTVRLEVWPDERGRATLRVSDTGIGIPPDELPRVTERFFRGERSATMAGGSGIGLTIVAELVRAHDGDLSIASEQQRGTTVTITLPRLSAWRPNGPRYRTQTIASQPPGLEPGTTRQGDPHLAKCAGFVPPAFPALARCGPSAPTGGDAAASGGGSARPGLQALRVPPSRMRS